MKELARRLQRQRGFGLIDALVGVVIALVAVLVVLGVFAVFEQYKRNATAMGDAQVNGLLSSFVLGLQLANAGNALATASNELGGCSDPDAGADWVERFTKSWRPLAIVIEDSGDPKRPDKFAVAYSTATTIVVAAPAKVTAAGYLAQSPSGFHPRLPGERDDLVIAIRGTECAPVRVYKVADSSDAAYPAADGWVELSYNGTGVVGGAPDRLFNMGPADDVQKVLYDLDDPIKPSVLRSTRLTDGLGQPANDAPNPIASNVVNLKLQYGIDTNADGLLDTWVSATGPWAVDAMLSADADKIGQIKAVRIGLIVRSDQFDKGYAQEVPWSLFDGAYSGTFAQPGPVPGNWRYRVYETAIPLRNTLWNAK
jgi:type IV pilus assembly protein PilW